MKKMFFLLLSLFSFTFIFSQNTVSVTGQLRDEITQETLPFANVTIQSPETNTIITGAITNENGRFEILGLATGKYTLVFSFIGYESLEKPLIAGGLNPIFDLGQITLTPSAEQLNEVQVVGQEAAINADLNKKSFNLIITLPNLEVLYWML
jgi:hypothetical protein